MAETYEVANDSIDKRNDVDDKPELSKFWLGEIAAAKKRDQPWHKRADKVVARYRDERSDNRSSASERRANVFWSNTETLKSTLFQGLGSPDVRRRFNKKGDSDKPARQAALVLERGLSYCADAYDAESQIEACIEDQLVPGRGTGWIVYDAEISEYAQPEDVKEGEDAPVPPAPEIAQQTVKIEHVFYKDFLTSAGRKWSDVWWASRGHDYSRDELKRYFPKHADKIPLNVSLSDSPKKGGKEEEDTFKRARIWEIWDQSKKQRVYVAEEYDLVLKTDDDPYKLERFFPTVEPLYGVKTTSSLTPIPEYTLYQDQAEELDIIQTRLCRLTDALKRRGVYDAGTEGSEGVLSQLAFAGDNEFIALRGFAALMEKGGLERVFMTEDLTKLVTVIDKLSMREQMLLQKIYEITGISDILRGASDPNETMGAQKIKAQFGSLRLQKRQKRIQAFIRDLFRLKAEIMAEHFTREQLAEMTGIDMPLKAEQDQAKQMLAAIEQQKKMAQQAIAQAQAAAKQGMGAVQAPQMPPQPDPKVIQKLLATVKAVSWEEISGILRSDQRRGYKIDIETDATNALDSETEKTQRMEFLTTMQGMFEKVIPGLMQYPQLAPAAVPLFKENAMFAVGAFKAGRTMEEAYEDAFDQIEQTVKAALAQGPQPSEEEKKLQLEAKSKQMEFEFKAKESEQDRQIKQQEFEHSSRLKEAEFQHQTKLEEFKAQQEAALAQRRLEQEQQLKAVEFDMQQQAVAHTQDLETKKFDFERGQAEQKFMLDAYGQEQEDDRANRKLDQDASLSQAKLAQDGEAKMASIDAKAATQPAANGAAPPRSARPVARAPAGGLAGPMGDLVKGLQQALMQQAEMFSSAMQQMAQMQAEALRVAAAPRELVKDPRTGAKRVHVVLQ